MYIRCISYQRYNFFLEKLYFYSLTLSNPESVCVWGPLEILNYSSKRERYDTALPKILLEERLRNKKFWCF